MKGPSTRVLRSAGLALLALVGAGAALFLLLPIAVRAVLGGFNLTLDALIWASTSLGSDADVWTLISAVGHEAATVLITSKALAVVGVLVLVSGLALYGLQRLLGSEEESSR